MVEFECVYEVEWDLFEVSGVLCEVWVRGV